MSQDAGLAEFVRILGRGPGRSRSLTQEEAQDAMTRMLSGDAAPEALGAILMLLRMKGEDPQEIAGFAAAAQAALPELGTVDLDWPSYAAGRTRGHPWFLLSAKLVANAGHRVLIHGYNGADPKVRAGLAAAGIPTAAGCTDAKRHLDRRNIVYLPLETAHPALFRLLQLRDRLGLRSCVNTVCRMLNPGRANASVQGVFHPSYRSLQTEAALRLGWQGLSVIKGGGGEFERLPSKEISVSGIRSGARYAHTWPALVDETRRLADRADRPFAEMAGMPSLPEFETQVVLGTAELALATLGDASAALHGQTLRVGNAKFAAA